LLSHLEVWSRLQLRRELRPYQLEAGSAILSSIGEGRGDVITVMMSRQAGKNELSAQLESFLRAHYQGRVETAIKAAPTFKPQVINSLLRLQTMLELGPLTAGRWRSEHGYIVRLGRARWLFFSAAPGASIVGATASLLLEVDEAQDVDNEKFDRDFRPMAATRISACLVSAPISWVREWQIDTVALAPSSSRESGRPTILLRPSTTA